jgi:Ca-activated chloride channel homolog
MPRSRSALPIALAVAICACSPSTTDPATTVTTGGPTTTVTQATTEPGSPGTTVSTGEVTLSFPDEVGAGTLFEVFWSGDALADDWVAIVEVGSPVSSWVSYFYTRDGSPGELVAPLEEGDYSIRFVEDATNEVLIELPIMVTPLVVSLEAPDQVAPGATFDVTFTGPDGPGDYITIVEAGSPPSAYLDYKYTNVGSPLTLTAPDSPGNYEVRYATGGEAVVIATLPILVD